MTGWATTTRRTSSWPRHVDAFTELGAQPELANLDQLTATATKTATPAASPSASSRCCGSSPAGKSNRAIADALVISTHTVARHVQNIFSKTA